MRAVVQRVTNGRVSIEGRIHAEIGTGVVILLGIRGEDGPEEAVYLANKCLALRIFDDPAGKMNMNIHDAGGNVLVVSQFTLHAETRKGNRPSFVRAAGPEHAEKMYGLFVDAMRESLGESRVLTGVFRSMMEVLIVNDGPVTIIVDSPNEGTLP